MEADGWAGVAAVIWATVGALGSTGGVAIVRAALARSRALDARRISEGVAVQLRIDAAEERAEVERKWRIECEESVREWRDKYYAVLHEKGR